MSNDYGNPFGREVLIPDLEASYSENVTPPLNPQHILPKLKRYLGVRRGTRISDVLTIAAEVPDLPVLTPIDSGMAE